MTGPVIGVTTYRNQNALGFSQYSASENYIQSLINAGAYPVMIPSGLKEEAIDTLLPRLDGLMFTGGGDIHPRYYGAEDHPLVSEVDTERDHMEFYLLQKSLHKKLPLLGICRGFQLINVGLGGSLYEDIQAQNAEFLKHDYFPDWPRTHLAHQVSLEPGNRLAQIFGASQIEVNSLHHQAVRQISDRLEVLGKAPDGILEAFQIRDYPYGIAVQWHPEWMQDDPKMQALFRSFVEAAKE